jgi:hypothetical protein
MIERKKKMKIKKIMKIIKMRMKMIPVIQPPASLTEKKLTKFLHNEANKRDVDAQFKHWVTQERRFNLVELNGKQVLYSYKKPRETKNRRVNLKDENLEVAIKEDFFDIIYSIH